MEFLFGFVGEFLFAKIFAFRPVVSKENDCLVARSCWRSHLFSFGFGSRRVIVDPRKRIVRVLRRTWWFYRTSRRIEFDWIDKVVYGYTDLGVGWARRALDLFVVSLHLRNGQEVPLFRFYGEGDFVNETTWPDWCYWEEFAVTPLLRQSQEPESLAYVEAVVALTGAELMTES